MNKVQVLDCTLRDGGYCNQWQFGYDNTKKIIEGLVNANIDIIECGFLTNKISYGSGITKYTTIKDIEKIIPANRNGRSFVVMMNYGEYNVDNIPDFDGSSIDGVRVAFHKKDLIGALEDCEKIKKKGYKVFVQAMLSLSYSDKEFIELIYRINEIKPYAFYIVDSFGAMKQKDLIRLFCLIENNLSFKDEIWVGFHSHNNMQLAYSNAQSLTEIDTNCNLIIDASVYGMGRGAGNLNTELFVEFLNEKIERKYELKPLLNIIDEILNEFYQRNYWGYSLSNYLAAKHNVHPNYAAYLDDKKTLTVEDVDNIFDMMEEKEKNEFNKKYIEEIYFQYMISGNVQDEHRNELREKLKGKRVLLIAPGKSAYDEKEKIIEFSNRNDVVSISVNFDYQYSKPDFIFISNLRRFRELDSNKRKKCIATSNIPASNIYLQIKYRELLNDEETVKDNAGMMVIKFLIQLGVNEVYLAGFDGYSHDVKNNYVSSQLEFITRNAVLDAINLGMSKVLNNYKNKIKIISVTKPRHIII